MVSLRSAGFNPSSMALKDEQIQLLCTLVGLIFTDEIFNYMDGVKDELRRRYASLENAKHQHIPKINTV